MEVSCAIQSRRSVKMFDPYHCIREEEVRRLMEHAILSPTAFNLQHWRFVRVVDAVLRQQIRSVAWDQCQVTDAALLLIICMDLKAWTRNPAVHLRNAPAQVRERMISNIYEHYADNEQSQRDEGIRSCSMVAMALMLMAKDMGYDSCPMVGFDYDRVTRLIHLPDDHAICMMLAIGKRLRDPWPRLGQLSLEEVLIIDRFSERCCSGDISAIATDATQSGTRRLFKGNGCGGTFSETRDTAFFDSRGRKKKKG